MMLGPWVGVRGSVGNKPALLRPNEAISACNMYPEKGRFQKKYNGNGWYQQCTQWREYRG